MELHTSATQARPNIYLRNYETSKDRANIAEAENLSNLIDRQQFNEKLRPIGIINIIKKTHKSKEKHCPLMLKDQDDFSRIKQAV